MIATIGQLGPDNAKITLGDMDKLKAEAMNRNRGLMPIALATALLNRWMKDRDEPHGITERETEIVLQRNAILYRR